jgi:pyruvate,water dikinase
MFFPAIRIRQRYTAFKELLEYDHICHNRIADLELIHSDSKPVDFCAVKVACEELTAALLEMADRLAVMAPKRYLGLKEKITGITGQILQLSRTEPCIPDGLLILTLDELGIEPDLVVGGKAKNLAYIQNKLNLPIPNGFVITTRAFQLIIETNALRPQINALLATLQADTASVSNIADKLSSLLLNAHIPAELEAAILTAHSRFFAGQLCSVRSSAVAEDSSVSFAGIYQSILKVNRESLLSAYKRVIAGKYSTQALLYRIHNGLLDEETPMAVLVLAMVDAKTSGIIYTADPLGADSSHLLIFAVPGLGETLATGARTPFAGKFLKDRSDLYTHEEAFPLDVKTIQQLAAWAVQMETHFGYPLDCEWCQDLTGELYLLQVRPLGVEHPSMPESRPDLLEVSNPVIFTAGERASSGVASGPVYCIHDLAELDTVPRGSILVAPATSPKIVTVLAGLHAVITDVGSAAGHLASVAREWGIPLLVNCQIATEVLHTGQVITVDTDRQRVYEGVATELLANERKGKQHAPMVSPFRKRLNALLDFISHLSLTNPASPTFALQHCATVHDALRFIHEKAVTEMFSLGENRKAHIRETKKLATDIPLLLYLLDLGNGLIQGMKFHRSITLEQVVSLPFLSFWEGLTQKKEDWRSDIVHLDWQNLEQVTSGDGIIGTDSWLLASFAVVSEDYMNLSLRFGFHFTIVDAMCGKNHRENYISMRFEGGGGAREGRTLRAIFIKMVLQKEGFDIQLHGDAVYAVSKRISRMDCQERLEVLGRLLSLTRLLDMRLTSLDQVEIMAAEFSAQSIYARDHKRVYQQEMQEGYTDGNTPSESFAYKMTWITGRLAVGHAPASYEELASIKSQGIHAIVNLCAEFCDLHQIEKDYGFEVFYLPVADDDAPELEPLEQALAWLDEAMYLGKKILVHCRLGIGRTGTFVRSYLLRRGFGPKLTEDKLQMIQSHPTSFNQWKLLRKYGKKEGRLTVREPSLEGRHPVNLDPFFAEYENLSRAADQTCQAFASVNPDFTSCGKDTLNCCTAPFGVQFAEAVYLYHHMNRELSKETRLQVIKQAGSMERILRGYHHEDRGITILMPILHAKGGEETPLAHITEASYLCPLNHQGKCLLYTHRPIRCRIAGLREASSRLSCNEPFFEHFPYNQAERELSEISKRLFLVLSGTFLEDRSFYFVIPHIVTGKFIQEYFAALTQTNRY